MADTKISDLPAVTTPASTDEFAVNQGGTSKKETRAQLHALESGEHLLLPQVDEAATPTLAFGDGDTGFYESGDDTLKISVGGNLLWLINVGRISSSNSGHSALLREAPTATNPSLIPSQADFDTGVGRQGVDNLSLIAGGLEAIRVEDPADLGATETSLWLYDDDTGAIVQVTVGIDDSGGAGFKLLRIAN
jgi:hypothetical protein